MVFFYMTTSNITFPSPFIISSFSQPLLPPRAPPAAKQLMHDPETVACATGQGDVRVSLLHLPFLSCHGGNPLNLWAQFPGRWMEISSGHLTGGGSGSMHLLWDVCWQPQRRRKTWERQEYRNKRLLFPYTGNFNGSSSSVSLFPGYSWT